MKQAINSMWEALEKAQEIYESNSEIKFDLTPGKKDSFHKKVEREYAHIKKKYMRSDVISLDRHKVAAIIICAIIEENIISAEEKEGMTFLGAEMIALSVGLSYMQRSLNKLLYQVGAPKAITGYFMPRAMACKTDYFDILARNLHYSRKDYQLNPLDLADKLFLLEYLTLKDAMIDPQMIIDASTKPM